MCANCKRDCKYGPQPGPILPVIDWSRIPIGLDEVRRIHSGSVWASTTFRVLDCQGRPIYRNMTEMRHIVEAYKATPVLEKRPETKSDYLIHCPGLYPEMVSGLTKVGLQNHLQQAGYGPVVRVYKLELVAESKQVEVKTIETQLVWSN
ncbi:MAG: hypothetical protein [Bacteriophage sp.]|nr:MAG: hypothetical protein [Bacteriophage sp.]